MEFRIIAKSKEIKHIELLGRITTIRNKKYFTGNILDINGSINTLLNNN